MKRHTPPYSDAVRRAVIEADRRGVPRSEISKEFGVSSWTIRSWAGLRREPVRTATDRLRLRQQAKDLHWAGNTYVCIAKQLGISTSTAWDYVNRLYDERSEQ